MKKAKVLFFALLLVLLGVSCTSEPETTSLRVEMDKGKRTITPSTSDMEIYGYRIIPVNAEGKAQTERYTYYSYINLDGLTVGNWTIKVYGFSKDRMDLAYGETTVTLKSGKNATRIEVKELVGSGSMDISLLWDTAQFTTAYRVEAEMTNQAGERVEVAATTPSSGSSSIQKDSLNAGSYVLKCHLVDKEGNQLSGFTEAIRITNKVTTSTTIKFSSTEVTEATSDVTLSDMTSVPIEVKINGLESLVEAGRSFTTNISVLTKNLTADQLTTEWYLDGIKVGNGTTLTMENGVSQGKHRLDVVVSTQDNGSIGSASFSFQAATSSDPGAPYQRNLLQEGGEYKMGDGTVVGFLPDHKMVIASNCSKTVQLVDLSGASPKLTKEYDYEELHLKGNVVDFASYGEEDDINHSIIFLVNNGAHPTIVNVICSKDQMSYIDFTEDLDPSGEETKATELVSITPGDEVFIVTIQSPDKSRMGYIYVNQNPKHGEIINRNDWFLADPTKEYGYSGFKNIASLPEIGYTIITSGQRSKILKSTMQASGKALVSESMMWVSWDDYMTYYKVGKTKAEFNDALDCGFVTADAQYAYVFSTEGIYYYKDCRDNNEDFQQYYVESLSERKIGDIRMCPDAEFGYLIDNDKHRLVTLKPILDKGKGGYLLVEGDWIELPETSSYNHIEINQSGNLLALYNTARTESITAIKAAR